jgi:hypothetical protein
MSRKNPNIERCPIDGCGCGVIIIAGTTDAQGHVRRRCECKSPKRHRFTLYGNAVSRVSQRVTFDGPSLTTWRPYPFTDTASLQRAAL